MRARSSNAIALLALLLLAAASALASDPAAVETPSIFDPAAHTARAILEYGMLVVGICTAIFVVVGL